MRASRDLPVCPVIGDVGLPDVWVMDPGVEYVEESKPLLDMLYAHGARPEYTYRFQWAPGSIAFWDNRITWHYALNDYPGARRLMHRITIEGEPLAA